MKSIIKHSLFTFFLCTGILSCTNPEEIKDIVYFAGTDISPVVTYSLEEPEAIGISIRSSAKVTDDTKVGIKANAGLLAAYNDKNGTNYKPLPDHSYTFDTESAIIKSGKYASEPFYLQINSIDNFKDEDTYCLPVEISGIQTGNQHLLESSQVMYAVLKKTIITKAAKLSGNYFYVDFSSDPGRDLSAVSQLSMEARIFVDAFQESDPYISTIIGCEENFLLRLGDVKIPKDYLQLAGGGYPVSSVNAVTQSKWVHVAVTYDGKRITLYIDGKLNAYVDAPRGPINLFDGSKNSTSKVAFYIGTTSNSTKRTLKGKISEARIWTRALTESEIANNICAVSADSPDLLAYWKFNSWKDDANKNIVVDYTGHGYNAIGARTITWEEGVRCP